MLFRDLRTFVRCVNSFSNPQHPSTPPKTPAKVRDLQLRMSAVPQTVFRIFFHLIL